MISDNEKWKDAIRLSNGELTVFEVELGNI